MAWQLLMPSEMTTLKRSDADCGPFWFCPIFFISTTCHHLQVRPNKAEGKGGRRNCCAHKTKRQRAEASASPAQLPRHHSATRTLETHALRTLSGRQCVFSHKQIADPCTTAADLEHIGLALVVARLRVEEDVLDRASRELHHSAKAKKDSERAEASLKTRQSQLRELEPLLTLEDFGRARLEM